MEPIISFRNFTFKYRTQVEPTLYDINLDIYPGEKVLIIGPSGSGKSTLAHCINGLVPFSYEGEITGEYRICGKNPKELDIFALSQMVGTVLQDTDGQFIGLTVAEDIAFALENDGMPHPQMLQKVDEVADIVEVKRLLSHSPSALSGGQKQRVSMAGVLVDDVDILLFDEPLANLDPATGKTAIALIDDIQKQQDKTILIIEHRLEDALYRDADRVILVGDGRIVCDMTLDALLTTDILQSQGIREPLYITALKHAGCAVTEESRPAHIDTLQVGGYAEAVRRWYQSTRLPAPEAKQEEILSVSHLDFSYEKGEPVLRDISFSIDRGEMAAIVGKNGAGKTTLSNLICGFLTPDAGEIRLERRDITPLSIRERGEKIGLVMQNPNQMISKPMIYEEVALGLSVRGVPEEEIRERVYETLKICGLYPFRNWPISALSFGQKKRVTVASILVMNPDILILDEPTAGQDFRHYTEIMEFLKYLNEKRGITILMITHDMHLMLEYTNRAIVIADGELLCDASPAQVLTDAAISERAYLKQTSLYDLARLCGIEDAQGFVERFIYYERTHRQQDGRRDEKSDQAQTPTGEQKGGADNG